ncbi:hypothetical protein [Sphingomonas sp. PB4P5]|uniref:hypothetical protein n=1 Tax=Parasphingomonas puruogangriensis TaxID=3096155 RepID=UPI002FCC0399
MKATRPLLAAAALLALNLAACSKEPEAPSENLSLSEDDRPVVEAAPEPTPIASPAPVEEPTDTNAAAALEPEPVTPPDEQMLDDASATGMTARATRDQAANDMAAESETEQQ